MRYKMVVLVLGYALVCTVTFGFPNSKKNSFRGNYMRKYGNLIFLNLILNFKKELSPSKPLL